MPNATSSIAHEIATLRRSLKAMDGSLRRLGSKLRTAVASGNGSGPARARRKLSLSPKRRAQLKLQGRYMVYLRALRPKQKAEVREVLKRKGMPAAVALAQKLMMKVEAA